MSTVDASGVGVDRDGGLLVLLVLLLLQVVRLQGLMLFLRGLEMLDEVLAFG